MRIIYNDDQIGLMRIIASIIFTHDGEVIGIIPKYMQNKKFVILM